MSIVRDVSKLGDNHLVLLLGIFALLTPGTGAIVAFHPSLFASLDIFKLLLIACVTGFITIAPTFLLTALVLGIEKQKEQGIPLFALTALFCAIVTLVMQSIFWLYGLPVEAYVIIHVITFAIAFPALIALRLYSRRR